LTIRRYWTPRLATTKIGLADAATRLDELMRRSVRQQMIADVEVGAFLSGGVDSASIVALAQEERKGNKPLKTFSAGFGDAINELPYARSVAQMYGTSHHEIDLADAPVASLVEEVAAVYDEPFGDSSCIPTYEIARHARQFVKVVLTGDGADELFAGYDRHAIVVDVNGIALPRVQWLVLSAARRMMPRSRLISEHSRRASLATWADPWKRSLMSQLIFGARERTRLWNGRRRPDEVFSPETAIATPEGGSDLSRALFFDLTTYLPGDLLVKVDRAAMAHGLETRAPFLDRDVAEFALSLPDALKLSGGRSKVILQTAFAGRWPEVVRSRQKQGFQAPIREWLDRPDMQPLLARVFNASSELSHLLPGVSHRKRRPDLGTWNLMMLGLWLQHRNTGSRV
jgi:asparagine synthase (glutamine-hydrolysing)